MDWKAQTEKAINAREPRSQYRLAKDLGVTQPAVMRWRNGGAPRYEHAIKLLEIAGEADSKKSTRLRRKATTAAAILITLVSTLAPSTDANAATEEGARLFVYYVK